MSVAEPAHPAVPDYPTAGPYAREVEAAYELFKEELEGHEGWEDQGERDGVQLYRKPDPNDAYAVPTVKGEAVIEGITSDQFMGVIQHPGMRKRWDSRFETGHMLQRFNRLTYSFYTVMKGLGWLVYARDICGVQRNFRSAELNKEIFVIQTSVVDDEHAPEQYGKTRATVTLSGWHLKPEGENLRVTYIVKIALNGSIPIAMVNMVALETPMCVGRARDVFYQVGHAPYVEPVEGDDDVKGVIFQTESFTDPGATPDDPGALEYRCIFTTSKGASFRVMYDNKRMYSNGVDASSSVPDALTIEDDGNGQLTVKCNADGNIVTLLVAPKA